eukprot:1306280-Rhodomonas_salina.6
MVLPAVCGETYTGYGETLWCYRCARRCPVLTRAVLLPDAIWNSGCKIFCYARSDTRAEIADMHDVRY